MALAQVRIKGMAVHVSCHHLAGAVRILKLMVVTHLAEVASEALSAMTFLRTFIKHALTVAQKDV